MLSRGDESDQVTVRNARLARRFRAVSYELATSLELAPLLIGRSHSIKHSFHRNPMGAIIPALMHRIASELRS